MHRLRILFRSFCSKAKSKQQIVGEQRTCEQLAAAAAAAAEGDHCRRLNVTLLGADIKMGQILSLLLKQHPSVGKIFLHGTGCPQMANDLRDIDTSCQIAGYDKFRELPVAIRPADIIVFLDSDNKFDKTYDGLLGRMRDLAKICSYVNPKAVMIDCVEPICCTLPIVQAVLMDTNFYNPTRILGCVSPLQMRYNTVVANYLNWEATYIQVPLLGGPDPETVVPLVSHMQPNPELQSSHVSEIFNLLARSNLEVVATPQHKKSQLNYGYAISQFVITVAEGMTGCKSAVASAMVRTNAVPDVKNLVMPVRFGRHGVEENFGVPGLSAPELEKFDQSVVILKERSKDIESKLNDLVQDNEILNTCGVKI